MGTPVTCPKDLMRACLVSTYPPRQCGIATFTQHLRDSLLDGAADVTVDVAAITAAPSDGAYPDEVRVLIDPADPASSRRAARVIDAGGYDVVCVQHEFGIFGGDEGRHVLDLLDELRTPTVTTLHTVLSAPEEAYRSTLIDVAAASDHLVVHSHAARRLLSTTYGLGTAAVSVIPHGVPDVGFEPTGRAQAALGFDGRLVLFTFGLLSENKGIEVVLDALPDVVATHPDVLYVVLGATHPEVRRHEGERYRERLQQQVEQLGLGAHVEFRDHYATQAELTELMAACDVYVTPYRSRDQIVSGTLAYAVGMGKAVLSTPYLYAEELLADGRGRLVGFDDPDGMAAGLLAYLGDPAERERSRARAYAYGRSMTWPRVGARYRDLFAELGTHRTAVPATTGAATAIPPAINIDHLLRLTDDVGIAQHATWLTPNRVHGYTTDDVSRALLVAIRLHARSLDPRLERPITAYASYLAHAQRPDGRFRNTLGYDRRWEDELGSEDTLGQTLWGLGTAMTVSVDDGIRGLCEVLYRRALPTVAALSHPRSIAYALRGLCAGLDALPGDADVTVPLRALAERLAGRYRATTGDGWRWFDDELTYANAVLAHALLLAGRALDDERLVEMGLEALDFLLEQTVRDGRFDPVGNERWHQRGGSRSPWGQQPIEAGYTVEAVLAAAAATGGPRADGYREHARIAVAWFAGDNRLGVPLYDPLTGACADGLDRDGVSRNAGAESTVCCLLGLMAAEDAGLGGRTDLVRLPDGGAVPV